VIENYRGRSYERDPEPAGTSRQQRQGELLYLVGKSDESYLITGITERSVAEKTGLRHLTVIIIPFITDGANKGCWIVHNRYDKQIAKGKISAPLSLNLFGGHCGPPEDDVGGLIGKTVELELLRENALRELSEELLCKNGTEKRLELWRDGVFAGEFLYASSYEVCPDDLIPVGFTEYAAKDNVEYSYIFALPVPEDQAEQIIAADNYEKRGQIIEGMVYEADIALPVMFMPEPELKRLWEKRDPEIEVCDAITRLWEEKNRVVYQRLIEYICTHEVF
jgi:8-oxo-dGTP pyrophosphatase MutT (NUDIX family)